MPKKPHPAKAREQRVAKKRGPLRANTRPGGNDIAYRAGHKIVPASKPPPLEARIGGNDRLNKADPEQMSARVAHKVGTDTYGRPTTEDSPGWKWWKQGNRMASSGYAKKNPPPKGWTTARQFGTGNVKAFSPRARARTAAAGEMGGPVSPEQGDVVGYDKVANRLRAQSRKPHPRGYAGKRPGPG